MEKGRAGEVYNIGGGTELTNKELTARLLAAMGADELMVERVVPDRKGHDRRYSLDIGKIHEEARPQPADRSRSRPVGDDRLVPHTR